MRNALAENKEDHKRFWRDLNILLDPTKGKKNDISLLDENDNLICANNSPYLLNTYYAELVVIEHQIDPPCIDASSYERGTNLSEFVQVTMEEIDHTIKSIKLIQTIWNFKYPSMYLKLFVAHKQELLMLLFNKSLQSVMFPE